jgi:hypothetical protein
MEKTSFLKSSKQWWKDYIKLERNYRQATYVDKYKLPARKIPFKHDINLLGHMADLRRWTI